MNTTQALCLLAGIALAHPLLAQQPPCDAIDSDIFSNEMIYVGEEGDPIFDMDVRALTGDTVLFPIIGQIEQNGTDPTTLHEYRATTTAPEQCQRVAKSGPFNYDTLRFVSSRSGPATIELRTPSNGIDQTFQISIHEGSFNPDAGCATWIGATRTSQGPRPDITVELEMGKTYIVFIQPSRNANQIQYPVSYRLNIDQNAPLLYTGEMSDPDYAYTYIAVDTIAEPDTVTAVSEQADFTTLGVGDYLVYGVNYDEAILPQSWVEEPLEDIRRDAQGNPACLQTSRNDIPLFVNQPTATPVDWVSFVAVEHPRGVALVWHVASETENDYFRVERTVGEGGRWHTIGEVIGRGTTPEPGSYRFVDPAPLAGPALYRLVQVDFDGTQNVSMVIAYQPSTDDRAGRKLRAFPNPAGDRLTVLSSGAEGVPELFDLRGRRVVGARARRQGAGVARIDLSGLPGGTYFVRWGGRSLRVVKTP